MSNPFANKSNSGLKNGKHLNDSIDLAITMENYPTSKISKHQFFSIQNHIIHSIDKGFHKTSPKFNGITLQDGVVHVYCVDLKSANWLCRKIQDVILWEKEKLQICVSTDLPQFVRVKFQVLGFNGRPTEIFKKFERENKGLSTKLWKSLLVKNNSKGQKQMVYIDNQSLDYLKRRNYTLFINFEKVVFECVKDLEKDRIKENEKNNYKKIGENSKRLTDFISGQFGFKPKHLKTKK